MPISSIDPPSSEMDCAGYPTRALACLEEQPPQKVRRRTLDCGHLELSLNAVNLARVWMAAPTKPVADQDAFAPAIGIVGRRHATRRPIDSWNEDPPRTRAGLRRQGTEDAAPTARWSNAARGGISPDRPDLPTSERARPDLLNWRYRLPSRRGSGDEDCHGSGHGS
ncbi:hypothetical protein DFH07DRAFT_323101 [Mycena maculata]|uniref:Uncharacterized protein n=1 Tax=Mycena maculata TaxID=230809 RepID=A0AAD7NZY6_9AGAR|nr:hypothetical protein DFH07DRAFT_323101 [Mycena maculata]